MTSFSTGFATSFFVFPSTFVFAIPSLTIAFGFYTWMNSLNREEKVFREKIEIDFYNMHQKYLIKDEIRLN
jgi:hypothetical protein